MSTALSRAIPRTAPVRRRPQLSLIALAAALVLALAACGKSDTPPPAAEAPATAAAPAAPAAAPAAVDPNSSAAVTSQTGTTTVPGQEPTSSPGQAAMVNGIAATPAAAGPTTPIPKGEPVKVTPESIAAGKALYVAIGCNACHGGTGGGGMCPPLTNSTWIYGHDDDTLRTLINEGTQGMTKHGLARIGKENVVGQMPPFGAVLKPGDVDHLVSFIHSINKATFAAGGK